MKGELQKSLASARRDGEPTRDRQVGRRTGGPYGVAEAAVRTTGGPHMVAEAGADGEPGGGRRAGRTTGGPYGVAEALYGQPRVRAGLLKGVRTVNRVEAAALYGQPS